MDNKVTAMAYQLASGRWVVGVFGQVSIGNGRSVLGYRDEIRCAGEKEARETAKWYNEKG